MQMKKIVLLALATVLAAGTDMAMAQDTVRGEKSYQLCASCHGFKGEGSQLVHAPRLAGQESWYLDRQIRNFRDGLRGGDADDIHGKTMATMVLGLASDEDIAEIVAYIGTLYAPASELTITGDVANGEALYATCAACHGVNGEGAEALNAPALAGMDDWYQLAQLAKFKSGIRGAVEGDTWGAQMVPMAATIPDEQAMKDLIAYINTLSR